MLPASSYCRALNFAVCQKFWEENEIVEDQWWNGKLSQRQCKFAMSAASRDSTMTLDFKSVTDALNLRDSKNFLTFGGFQQHQNTHLVGS